MLCPLDGGVPLTEVSQRRGSCVDVCPVGSQTFTLFTPLQHKNHLMKPYYRILDKNSRVSSCRHVKWQTH